MENTPIVGFLRGEMERLKTELKETKGKVDALKGELGRAEEKMSRQHEQLNEAAEIMLAQQKEIDQAREEDAKRNRELEKEREESKKWQGKWEELGESCRVVYSEFSGLMKVFQDHFKTCCEKRDKGREMERRLGEMVKLVQEKFGGGGSAQKPTSSKHVSGKSTIHQKVKKHGKDTARRKDGHFCICGAKFKFAGNLQTHIRVQTEEKRWTCDKCQYSFPFQSRLREHQNKCSNKGRKESLSWKCVECTQPFESKAELLKHRQLEHCSLTVGVQSHEANVQNATQDRSEADEEEKQVPRSIPIPAPPKTRIGRNSRYAGKEHRRDITKKGHFCVCGARFGMARNLRIHITRVTSEKKWKCMKCGLRFVYSSWLRRHEESAHKVANSKDNKNCLPHRLRNMDGGKQGQSNWKCKECGGSFEGKAEMLKHCKLEHAPNRTRFRASKRLRALQGSNASKPVVLPATATIIPEESTSGAGTKEHHQKSEKINRVRGRPKAVIRKNKHEVDVSKVGGHYCVCSKKFQTSKTLRNHIRIYTGQGKFRCNVCKNRFLYLSLLRNHQIARHHGNGITNKKTFGCGDCGSTFESMSKLLLHRKIKHKMRAKVSVVSKSPKKESSIVVPPVEPEKINVVKSSSTNRGNESTEISKSGKLDEIDPAHGEDMSKQIRGFFCVCGTQCSTKSNLQIHIKYYCNEGRFSCAECGMKFVYLSFLERHRLQRHGVAVNKPGSGTRFYGCRECGKKFNNMSELFSHRKMKHTGAKNRRSRVKQTAVPKTADGMIDRKQANVKSSSVYLPPMSSVARNFAKESKLEPLDSNKEAENGIKSPSASVPSEEDEVKFVMEQRVVRTTDSLSDQQKSSNGEANHDSKPSLPKEHGINPSNPHQCWCGYSHNFTFYVKQHVLKMSLKMNNQSVTDKLMQGIQTLKEATKQPNTVPEKNEIALPVPRVRVAIKTRRKKRRGRQGSRPARRYKSMKRSMQHKVDEGKLAEGFYCVCGSRYKSNYLLKCHVQYYSLKTTFPCHLCSRTFVTATCLAKHLEGVHKLVQPESTSHENNDLTNMERNTMETLNRSMEAETLGQGQSHPNGANEVQDNSPDEIFQEDSVPIPIPIPIYEDDTEDEAEPQIDFSQMNLRNIKVEEIDIQPVTLSHIKVEKDQGSITVNIVPAGLRFGGFIKQEPRN